MGLNCATIVRGYLELFKRRRAKREEQEINDPRQSGVKSLPNKKRFIKKVVEFVRLGEIGEKIAGVEEIEIFGCGIGGL